MPIRPMTLTSRLGGAVAADMKTSSGRMIDDPPCEGLRNCAEEPCVRGDARPERKVDSRPATGRSGMKRWKYRPEGSTWGDWGDDDQLGRLNLITTKTVLEGVTEVKEGVSFCLSLPLDLPGGNVLNPRRLPPVLSPTGDENGWRFNFLTKTINPLFMDVASDDRVILTLQYSTQWDTLAHVGSMLDADGDGVPEPLYYNGFRAGSDVVGPQPDAGRDGCGHMSYAHKLGPDNAEHPSLPIHSHCLFKLGLNLGEIWWLKDLALWLRDKKRSRFLLTAPPLRLPGAVGSPATPVATV